MTGIDAALRFLNAARRDESLRDELEQLPEDPSYEDLAGLGRRHGFEFTASDLAEAHAIDWRLRQAHYRLA